MFCVYGRSLQVAKKAIDRQLLKKSKINTGLAELSGESQEVKQAYIDKHVQEYFEKMKPKRCTHEFSTPEIAKEAYNLMKNDTKNFGDLALMKKKQKINAKGAVVISKSTKKPLMEWVPLHQIDAIEEAA